MFDDFVDTLKGAGAIGTFLGTFVLLAFVVFFVLVFDARLAGWIESDASVVTRQARDIESLEARLKSLEGTRLADEERKQALVQLSELQKGKRGEGQTDP